MWTTARLRSMSLWPTANVPDTVKRLIFGIAPIGVPWKLPAVTTTLSPTPTRSQAASSWPSRMLNSPGCSDSSRPAFILSPSTETLRSSDGTMPCTRAPCGSALPDSMACTST